MSKIRDSLVSANAYSVASNVKKQRNVFALLLLKFGLALFAVSANAEPTGGTREGNEGAAQVLAEKLQIFKAFEADFIQQVTTDSSTVVDETKGKFYISRPNHFRWQITEPFSQLIVGDGSHIWTYDEDLEQVNIQNQNKVIGNSPVLLLSSNEKQLTDAFVVQMYPVEDKPKQKLFKLTPKESGNVFASIHLLFKGEALAELMLEDTLGQTTSVMFENIQMNHTLAPELFSFEPPEGVDIVDSRENNN